MLKEKISKIKNTWWAIGFQFFWFGAAFCSIQIPLLCVFCVVISIFWSMVSIICAAIESKKGD